MARGLVEILSSHRTEGILEMEVDDDTISYSHKSGRWLNFYVYEKRVEHGKGQQVMSTFSYASSIVMAESIRNHFRWITRGR